MSILKPLPPVTKIRHQALTVVTPVENKAVSAVAPVARPAKRVAAPSNALRDQALSITQEILKNLAKMKEAFLRVVLLLGQVRDQKLYAALGCPTMEAYAEDKLSLKRSSLYAYLKVYDWMRRVHPAWLEPGAKIQLADLNDATDLIWIENALAKDTLPEANKTALEGLKKKALKGTLRRNELRAYKAGRTDGVAGVGAFLSQLRRVRETGIELAGLPKGVVAHLDGAIELTEGALSQKPK